MCTRSAALVAVLALAGGGVAVQPPAAGPPAPERSTGTARALSPRNANYTITVRLDPASRTLKGEQLLTWRNTAAVPATSLQLHLYYNAWRNTRSTWMREARLAGETALADRPASDWASIDVTSVKRVAAGGAPADLTAGMRYIAPDDGNADDRTVLEVPLDTPVAPGETINAQIAWSAVVPRPFARTGGIGNYYFLAQWFPKIGVFEDAGWNCRQFHYSTEFFADFGVYDVRLTVPAGWIVGATGRERGRRDEGDGTTTHHYYAEDVHDFAWTTSPDYLERTATFEHPALPSVAMRLLLQPEHAGQADRHFDATRAALKYYGEWYGPYPYGHVTIVDPAYQSDAGGMEYPTLFTAGTRWIAPRRVSVPESVTVHEAGHQFWYGIVATNEFEHAWMDEGLNSFSTARTLEQFFESYLARRYFGEFIPWVFPDIPLSRAERQGLARYRLAARADQPSGPSWRYWPGTATSITYDKTALWLNTLERLIGWDTLQRALSTYFARSAFEHPRPEDFFAAVNEASGRDLTWFFDQVYRSANAFDYGIGELHSEPVRDRGYVDRDGRRTFSDREGAADRFRTTVVARRYAEGIFPVDVRLVFENGEETRWRWDGRETWKLFEVERPVRAVYAQVDPDRVLLLDPNYTNNSRSLAPKGKAAARKWSLAWLVWLQDHLLTYGFFL